MSDASPYKPSVATYFPHVPDFARDANGDPIISSLRGPERTEARQQLARERLVAAAEVKILHEQLKWCYFQEGVNHLQNCKVRRRRDGAEGGGGVAFVSGRRRLPPRLAPPPPLAARASAGSCDETRREDPGALLRHAGCALEGLLAALTRAFLLAWLATSLCDSLPPLALGLAFKCGVPTQPPARAICASTGGRLLDTSFRGVRRRRKAERSTPLCCVHLRAEPAAACA